MRDEGPRWERAAVSLPNAVIVNCSTNSEQRVEVRSVQCAPADAASERGDHRLAFVASAWSRGGAIVWSGKWTESFTGSRETENQTFSLV